MMLRIYDVVLEVIRGLGPVLGELERRDGDLARQLRRAAASVALNVAEGSRGRGGNRRVRYASALGSMEEARSCLQVAAAFGYVRGEDAALAEKMRHVIGTLVKVTR